jgi:hypothetical protein
LRCFEKTVGKEKRKIKGKCIKIYQKIFCLNKNISTFAVR